eukprot:gene2827-3270_t
MAGSSNNSELPDAKAMHEFLSKVDEVGSLIKDMSAGDLDVANAAYEKAGKLIDKEEGSTSQVTVFNKSIVNKNSNEEKTSESENNGLNFTEGSISSEEFMKRVEEDSAERRKQRVINERDANKLKDLGNEAFKNKDYEASVKHYSQAIATLKDNTVYYTNRAQAYIKLEKYVMAFEDCSTALKLNKKCIKAYVHRGRSLNYMNRFDEAIECFEQISKLDKKHKELAKGYVEEVNERRVKYEELQKVSRLSESEDESSVKITNTIKRLRRENCSVNKLMELITLVKDLITNDLYKTLFRIVGGFQIIFENPSLARIFKSATLKQGDETDSIYETLELFSLACTDNDENVAEILTASFLSYIEKFLRPSSPSSSALKVRLSALCLVHKITQSSKGRTSLLDNDTLGRTIFDHLMSLLGHGGEIAVVAAGAINNLALCDNLSKELLDSFKSSFIPFVVKMMETLCECRQEVTFLDSMLNVIPTSFSAIGNLARNKEFRLTVAADQSVWKTAANFLALYEASLTDKQKRDAVYSLLGLLMNLASSSISLNKPTSVKLHDSCVLLLAADIPMIVERASGLLNRLMSSCPELINHVIKKGHFKAFISVMTGENEIARNHIIKCIALCTSASSDPIAYLTNKNAIESLLAMTKSNDATVAGNAALCIGDCAKDDLRTATTEKTLNSRLIIHWNGVPTAKFNPRSAVQTFLTMNDRRMNLPKIDSY